MSDVYRYEFDENGVCYRKPDGPFVSHDDYAAIHYERIHDLNQIGGMQEENARLKAEVERLKEDNRQLTKAFEIAEGIIKRMGKAAEDAAKEGKPSV